MNWLLPGFLAGGAVIGLPVVLHFLRSKPKTIVRFPSLRFLGETAIRDTRKHRLRRWLTLALRCLVIGLLAAAFARPFWVAADAAHRRVMVVAVDNSMSMQAGSRWAERTDWALRQLADLQPGDQAGVLLINPTPTWLVPLSTDVARARAALQQLKPGFEKTRYSAALRLAGQVLAANPAGEKTLVWMTDEQTLGWHDVKLDEQLPAGVKIRFADTAPEPKREAAITKVQWEIDGAKTALGVTMHLYHPERDERKLTVSNGRQVLETRVVKLIAGENKISVPLQTDAVANVRVALDADDFAADDTAWLGAATASAHPVLVDGSTADVDFLQHALQSTRRLDAAALQPAPLPQGDWPAGGVAILRDAESFRGARADKLEKFLHAGGGAWIFVNGAKEQADWLATHGVKVTERAASNSEEPMHLRDWDPDHPILGVFAGESLLPLMQVEFYRGFNLDGENLTTVARWPSGEIALTEMNSGRGRIFLAGMPLDRNATNWPVQPSFVPFVHQTVRWLASLASAPTDWHVGDTITLPGDGVWRTLESPASEPERHVSGSVRPGAPGLYEFVSGDTRTVFAVNVPPEESDLTPWPKPEQLLALESKGSAEMISDRHNAAWRVSDEVAEAQQRLWWWLLAICGAGLLAELALANRTAL